MNNKEYLNEEWYQKAKKKVKRVALIILIIGILIGGTLIITGVVKQNSVKKTNEQRKIDATKEAEEKGKKINQRLSEITSEKEKLNNQYNSKKQECDSLNTMDSDWFSKVNQCNREASAVKSQIYELETEEFKLKNGDHTVYFNYLPAIRYLIFYYIGAGVIGVSLIVSGLVYFFAMKREVVAFKTQQVMPLAQEGIQKMAPTVGNAVGEVAHGITKGIKDGLDNNRE